MIGDLQLPDSQLVRDAEALARAVSSDMLFNHVMRCYWFGELLARQQGVQVDRELLFLSNVLHDLGLTEHARGPLRFEIEGANAARTFLTERGVSADRAQKVWDAIALHVWDVNLYRDETSRIMQLGVLYDVVGLPDAGLDPSDVDELLRRYPRLNFKQDFHRVLTEELDSKQPYNHFFHICTHIQHARTPVTIPDASALLNAAPFDE